MNTRVLIILLFIGLRNVCSQENTIVKAQIDSLIQGYMKTYRIPGLSIGIVSGDSSYYLRGYGYTSIDSKIPVTEQTLFHTASITKLFTATAIMQLVHKGEIHLSDRVTEHLPEFTMKDERYKEITIEQLLTHTSGLPWEHKFKHSPDDSKALEKFVFDLRKEKLRFNPGEKFDGTTYSNVAYSLLGYLLQKKSNMTFVNYVRDYLLAPCNMTNSTFTQEQISDSSKAYPHLLSGNSKEIKLFNYFGVIQDENPVLKYPENQIVIRNKYGRPDEHDPNSGLVSSSSELSLWMIELLKIYNNHQDQLSDLISNELLVDSWKLHYPIEGKKTSLGICWWRHEDADFGEYVYHVGREPGFCSTLMIFPENSFGITILCNAMYADQVVWNKLPFEIMELLNLNIHSTNKQ